MVHMPSTNHLSSLRTWQKEALEAYRTANKRNFLVVATPGAGKTTLALSVAKKLLEAERIDTIIVVAPTDHLRTQWSDAACEMGIYLDPTLANSTVSIPIDFHGYATTYAQIAASPAVHFKRSTSHGRKTLVIFDEIHHAGDGLSWEQAISSAFEKSQRRLILTGTPFRTGAETIPFVTYEHDSEGNRVSKADYTYGYKEALKDGVVRPVTFAAYSGQTAWKTSAGNVLSAALGDPTLSSQAELSAWRTVLDPKGQWLPHVLGAADARLTEIRAAGMSNAAGMVFASDKEKARDYAKLVAKITKTKPVLVLSDDRGASKKIAEFSSSENPDDRWIVSVRMVSEGTDIPRLAVGVWATNYRTPLFFAQAVGRFVRQKRTGEVATVFLPAVRPLLALAADLEEARNHVIAPPETVDDETLLDPILEEEKEESHADEFSEYEALESEAEFAHVLFGGKAYDGKALTEEEKDYLGLPGLLSPHDMASLLQKRSEEQKRLDIGQAEVPLEVDPRIAQAAAAEARKNLNKLVSRYALSHNLPHAQVHSRARKAIPGPPSASADEATLLKRISWLNSL